MSPGGSEEKEEDIMLLAFVSCLISQSEEQGFHALTMQFLSLICVTN